MISDFYAGLLVAWQLDGVHFALGPTMVSTRQRVKGFGGFEVLENRPADDLLFGRLIAEQGVEVKLLPYAVETVPDFEGLDELLYQETALDDGDACHAAMGTFWPDFHLGIAVDYARRLAAPDVPCGCHLLGLAICCFRFS